MYFDEKKLRSMFIWACFMVRLQKVDKVDFLLRFPWSLRGHYGQYQVVES